MRSPVRKKTPPRRERARPPAGCGNRTSNINDRRLWNQPLTSGRHLHDIGQINLQAITRKNDYAATNAEEIIGWLGISGTILMLITYGEQQKLTGQIRQESERLLRISGELLDVVQIETGNIRLNATPTRIPELVSYAANAVQSMLTDKQLRLETLFSDPLPDLLVDAEKTAWVLVNLLSNAAKHSPEGERIIVDASRKNGSVEVGVRDFGQGIDEKYQQRLFEKFFQAPTSSREAMKNGSGLGLAISKDFIEAQGGHIWVENSQGNGARFVFSLPVPG